MTQVDLLIGGAGLAAASLLDELGARGDTRSVLIVGDEGERPYERPGLSKGVLLGNDPMSSVYVHDQAHYDSSGVQTRWSDAVEQIDPDGRTARLASGERVGYTDLVLATGATCRSRGSACRGCTPCAGSRTRSGSRRRLAPDAAW